MIGNDTNYYSSRLFTWQRQPLEPLFTTAKKTKLRMRMVFPPEFACKPADMVFADDFLYGKTNSPAVFPSTAVCREPLRTILFLMLLMIVLLNESTTG